MLIRTTDFSEDKLIDGETIVVKSFDGIVFDVVDGVLGGWRRQLNDAVDDHTAVAESHCRHVTKGFSAPPLEYLGQLTVKHCDIRFVSHTLLANGYDTTQHDNVTLLLLLGRVALVAPRLIVIRLSRERSVGLCVGPSVCPVHCGKTADRIRMPFGIIGRTGAWMRQVVGFGDRSTGRAYFWGRTRGAPL